MKTFFSKLIFDAASFWEYIAVAMTYLIVAAFIWTIWAGVDKTLAPEFIFEFIGKYFLLVGAIWIGTGVILGGDENIKLHNSGAGNINTKIVFNILEKASRRCKQGLGILAMGGIFDLVIFSFKHLTH